MYSVKGIRTKDGCSQKIKKHWTKKPGKYGCKYKQILPYENIAMLFSEIEIEEAIILDNIWLCRDQSDIAFISSEYFIEEK